METMRIAIPSTAPGGLSSKRSEHFGHCETFTLVEIADGQIVQVDTVSNIAHGAGGCLKPVGLLKDKDVDSIVVVGMGARPLRGFAEVGIAVFQAELRLFDTVEEVVHALLSKKLMPMQAIDACQGNGACHH